MIEGHGDDLFRFPPGSIRSNFSTNIPTPPSHAGLTAYLASRDDLLRSYPEPEPLTLEAMIAGREGLDPASVMVCAGATQAIYLTAQSRRGTSSAIVVPTFREYEDACAIAGHDIRYISRAAEATDADNLWVCCPNNPTGSVTGLDTLRELASCRNRLIIIDAAYSSYTSSPVMSMSEAVGTDTVLMLRSLTKDFGVPGLRVGYAVGSPDIIRGIKRFRMPWAVGAIPLAAAEWLLEHESLYHVDSAGLHTEILRLSRLLRRAGVEVTETEANFALCRLPSGLAAASLKEYLAIRHGILIRDASNFHGLTSSHFRIAAQTPTEGDRLISAITEWITSQL